MMDDTITKQEFGALVQSMRNKEQFWNENTGLWQTWTQAELARRTNGLLNVNNVADIEQGTLVLRVERDVEPLASAFGLNETEKREFYAAAGFIYRRDKMQLERSMLTWLLQLSEHPAFATTALWEYVADNCYAQELYMQTVERHKIFVEEKPKANLLKVLFDERFDRKTLFGGYDNWRKSVEKALMAFRLQSFRYVAKEPYIEIMSAMRHNEEFMQMWKNLPPPQEDNLFLVEPTATIYHPTYGEMQFLTLLHPLEYLEQDVYVYTYIPTSDSVDNYDKLRIAVNEQIKNRERKERVVVYREDLLAN